MCVCVYVCVCVCVCARVCCSVVAGVELVKKGRQLEAIQHLNMALKIDPGHTEALVARGAV